jgi:hypothetical protein
MGTVFYEFNVLFEPGDALFETHVQIAANEGVRGEKLTLFGEMLRVSRYKNQSSCISEPRYLGFCYCY